MLGKRRVCPPVRRHSWAVFLRRAGQGGRAVALAPRRAPKLGLGVTDAPRGENERNHGGNGSAGARPSR